MSYLLDTNVLLRWAIATDPLNQAICTALLRASRAGDAVYVTPQNIIELWNVATRPADRNGLGMPHARAEGLVQMIEGVFNLLPDRPGIYLAWRRLVVAPGASGRQVHDARLAAVAMEYGITHIMTLNVADFVRYPLGVVHPRDVPEP